MALLQLKGLSEGGTKDKMNRSRKRLKDIFVTVLDQWFPAKRFFAYQQIKNDYH